MPNATEFETWNPNFYIDVYHGALPADELRRRTVSLIYTDNDRSYDKIEWELINNDGLLTRTEYLALGLVVRFRFGYTDYTTGWKSFIITRARGGVGVAGRANPAVSEEDCTITLEGRNRNAPDAKKQRGKKGSKKKSGDCANPKPTGKGRGCRYPGRGGGPTTALSRLDNLKRDAYTGPTEGKRIFSVQHLSDAVREIALRNGYPENAIYVQDTDDEVNSVVIPTGYTDADFLEEMAEELQWVYKAEGATFHFHEKDWRRSKKKTKHVFDYGAGRDIITLNIDGDFRLPAPRSTKAYSKNPAIRRTQVGTANHESTAAVNRYATLYYLDDVRRRGDSREERDRNTRRDFVFPTTNGGAKGAASEKAKSAFLSKNLRALEMRVRLVGNPSVLARDIAEIRGTGCQLVDGDWYVGQAKHIFDGDTYVTEIGLKQPPKQRKKGNRRILRTQVKGTRGKGSSSPAAATLPQQGTRAELRGAGLLGPGE